MSLQTRSTFTKKENKILHVHSPLAAYMCTISQPDTVSCDSAHSSLSYSEAACTGDSLRSPVALSLSAGICVRGAVVLPAVVSASSFLNQMLMRVQEPLLFGYHHYYLWDEWEINILKKMV